MYLEGTLILRTVIVLLLLFIRYSHLSVLSCLCFSLGEEGVHTEELDNDLGTSLFPPVTV